MKTGNIGIRNLADIGVSDIDVYGTGKRKKTIFKFGGTVKFYRSKDQSEEKLGEDGKLGKNDKSYTGKFGFDLYNENHCPKGSVIYYSDMEGKAIQDKEYKGYISPYLSIWPPKVDEEKSNIILYVKADDNSGIPESLEYECKEWSKDSKIFSITSTKLEITKLNTENLGEKSYYKINIKCTGFFENDISVVAKYNGNVVGRIIVKANAKVYETIIQPVLINFGSTASSSITILDKHDEFIENTFLPFLKNKSFNQSYIKGKLADKSKSVTFSKDDFFSKQILFNEGKVLYANRSKKRDYNSLVEERFAAYNSDAQEKQSIKEELMAAAFDIIKAFKQNFNFGSDSNLKKAKKFDDENKATVAWKNINVQTAYAKYNALKEKYKGDNFVDKKNTTYLFYSYDLEACKNQNSTDKVRAFSLTEGGTVHIFNFALKANEIAEKTKILDDRSEALIVHELGHAYGLHHTMDDVNAEAASKCQEEIDKLNTEIQEFLKLKQNSKEFEKYIRLDWIYTNIQKLLNIEKSLLNVKNFESSFLVHFTDDIKYKCWYYNREVKEDIFDSIVLKIEENIDAEVIMLNGEKKEKITFDSIIQQRRNEITSLTKQQKEYQKTSGIIAEQTKTLENFMDYSQYKELPEKVDAKNPNNLNENFSHKSFYKWQWETMMKIGRKKSYLSEIKQSK